MKFYVDTGPNQLVYQDYVSPNCYFCLAPLYRSNEFYKEFFDKKRTQENSYIILDNGAAEGNMMDLDSLLMVKDELNPDLVISRDFIGDGVKTMEELCNHIKKDKDAKLISAIQCKPGDYDELLNVFRFYSSCDNVKMIGIPLFAMHESFNILNTGVSERDSIRLKVLVDINQRYKNTKPLHLLSLDNPMIIPYYKRLVKMGVNIRSIDSRLPVLDGIHGRDWSSIKLRRQYENNQLDKISDKGFFDSYEIKDMTIIENNLKWLKKQIEK